MTTDLRHPSRTRTLMFVAVLLLVVGGLAIWLIADPTGRSKALSQRVDPLLPDLVMAPIADVVPTVLGTPLKPYVAFSASIANVGSGDFIVETRRSWPWSDDWVVYQRIAERAGGYTERQTTTTMIYGGDQHDHWHVRGVEAHRLERLDTGEVLAEVVKLGFCFFDVQAIRPDLAGAPPAARWPESACTGTVATQLTIGLSVGWEDVYPSDMREQAIPLTGVPSGRYRLHEIADPEGVFDESDETNNETWADIDIVNPPSGFPRVTVVERAPAP